jgi:uncharacterized protein (TIGR02646 family)
MKFITKNNEPKEFSVWKSNDKMARRNRPKWNRLTSDVKNALHSALLVEQGGICCYCERKTSLKDSHIEHFRPKSKREFTVLSCDYNNLLLPKTNRKRSS